MAFAGLATNSGIFNQVILPGAADNTGPNMLLSNQDVLLKLNESSYLVKGHAKSKARGRSQSKSKKAPKKASKSKGRKKSAAPKNTIAPRKSAGRKKSAGRQKSAGKEIPH